MSIEKLRTDIEHWQSRNADTWNDSYLPKAVNILRALLDEHDAVGLMCDSGMFTPLPAEHKEAQHLIDAYGERTSHDRTQGDDG